MTSISLMEGSSFPEEQRALQLTASLGNSDVLEELHLEELDSLLKPYQERPTALDSCIRHLCENLMIRIQSPACARAVYLLCKLRGRKSVSKLLPKQIHYLDDCLALLLPETCWESKYVGFVWLSLLLLLPFDLNAMLEVQSIQTLHYTCEKYLLEGRALQEPASFCLSRLVSRSDCKPFMDSLLNQFPTRGEAENSGILMTKAAVYKHAKFEDVEPFTLQYFLPFCETCKVLFPTLRAQQRKLHVKLLQRMFSSKLPHATIELGLNFLLSQALSDEDSRVRWQAAKAVSRISTHDQVFVWVLQLFGDHEDEHLWHGACLCLGEMIRRRKTSVPHPNAILSQCVAKCLQFDFKRGSRSFGSNIRDAACYVVWMLVRTVPSQLQFQDCHLILELLLPTCLFDREVSCRRAAAASLQEAVGRCGRKRFPLGVELLQEVNFSSVGSIQNTYGSMCKQVVRMEPELQVVLVRHLLDRRIAHWDEHIRKLAANALQYLVSKQEAEVLVLSRLHRLLNNNNEFVNQFELHGHLLLCASLLPLMSPIHQRRHELAKALDLAAISLKRNFPSKTFGFLYLAWFHLLTVACQQGQIFESDRTEAFDGLLREGMRSEKECRTGAMEALASCLRFCPRLDEAYSDHVCELKAMVLARVHTVQTVALLENILQSRTNFYEDRIEALTALCLGLNRGYKDCLVALKDNSSSNQHGNVGSWVRRQACLSILTLERNAHDKDFLQVYSLVSMLAVDKLDHVREAAIPALFYLMEEDLSSLPVCMEEQFTCVLQRCKLKRQYPTSGLWRGLFLTAGSATESASECARTALQTWFLQATNDDRIEMWDEILLLVRDCRTDEVKLMACLHTLKILLWELFPHRVCAYLSDVWSLAISDNILCSTNSTLNLSRLAAAGNVLLGLTQLGGETRDLWKRFADLLFSPEFPILRKNCAESFFLWKMSQVDESKWGEAAQVALTMWYGNGNESEETLQEFRVQFEMCVNCVENNN